MIADLVQLYKARSIELPEIIQNIVDQGPITNLEEIISLSKEPLNDYTPLDFSQITSNIKIIKPKKIRIAKNNEVVSFERIEADYLSKIKEILEELAKKQNIITVSGSTFTIPRLFKGNIPNISKNKDPATLESLESKETLPEDAIERPTIIANLLESTSTKKDYLYFWENPAFEAKNFEIPLDAPFFKKTSSSIGSGFFNFPKTPGLFGPAGFSFEMDENDTTSNILAKLAKMPDFMTNKYTAVLVPPTNDLDDNYLNVLKEFCFRLEGIEIPLPKRASFETKFLNTSIKRLEPTVETKRSGSLTIRLDEEGRLEKLLKGFEEQNTYYPKLYNKMVDFTSTHDGLFPQTEDISRNISNINKEIHTARKITKNIDWTLLVIQPIITEYDILGYFSSPASQNCPIRDYTPGLEPPSTIPFGAGLIPSLNIGSTLVPEGLTGKVCINLFTFSNVRFLGQTQALQYKSEGANTLNGSFKFIFRKVETKQLKNNNIGSLFSNAFAGIQV